MKFFRNSALRKGACIYKKKRQVSLELQVPFFRIHQLTIKKIYI